MVWMARAGRLHGEGRDAEALAALRYASELGPDWPEVQRALAVALHRAGGAGEVLQRAIELSPEDGLLKLFQAAESPVSQRPELLMAAVDAHPDDLDVALAATDALMEAGRPLEAIAFARERSTHLDDPALRARIAELEAPFVVDHTERERRPTQFRTLPDGTEEVIVYSPGAAKRELDFRLRMLGYGEVKRIPGGRRYQSTIALAPWVEVFDDGRVEVQERGLIEAPEGRLPDGEKMIPVISKRKLRGRRTQLMEDIWYEVTVWRQAKIRVAFQEQMDERLPDQLVAIWEQGEPMYGQEVLGDARARRAALLDYWSSRACTEDGDYARKRVETFLRRVVQESDQPASIGELEAAEERCPCSGRKLALDVAP